eukprot:gene1180-1565_t
MLPIPQFDQFKPPYAEYVFKHQATYGIKKGGKPIKTPVADEENSLSFRREMNKRALNAFRKKPVFGLGSGGIEHEFVAHKNKSKLVDLHFYWLEMLVNYGTLWFVGLVVALVYTARKLVMKVLICGDAGSLHTWRWASLAAEAGLEVRVFSLNESLIHEWEQY